MASDNDIKLSDAIHLNDSAKDLSVTDEIIKKAMLFQNPHCIRDLVIF